MTSYIVASNKGAWGAVVQYPTGWRFLPWTDAHKRSRKAWPTAESAVPSYVERPFKLIERNERPYSRKHIATAAATDTKGRNHD